jgi:hypothetical protein
MTRSEWHIGTPAARLSVISSVSCACLSAAHPYRVIEVHVERRRQPEDVRERVYAQARVQLADLRELHVCKHHLQRSVRADRLPMGGGHKKTGRTADELMDTQKVGGAGLREDRQTDYVSRGLHPLVGWKKGGRGMHNLLLIH